MVIDAPIFVLPPYAAGKTIVFSPIGVAYAISVITIISWFTLRRLRTPANTPGRIINLCRVA